MILADCWCGGTSMGVDEEKAALGAVVAKGGEQVLLPC